MPAPSENIPHQITRDFKMAEMQINSRSRHPSGGPRQWQCGDRDPGDAANLKHFSGWFAKSGPTYRSLGGVGSVSEKSNRLSSTWTVNALIRHWPSELVIISVIGSYPRAPSAVN